MPSTNPSPQNELRDSWGHIQDAKERKKVQNRIAQRTYRQRTRERMAGLERLERLCGGASIQPRRVRRAAVGPAVPSTNGRCELRSSGCGNALLVSTASSSSLGTTSEGESVILHAGSSLELARTTDLEPSLSDDGLHTCDKQYVSSHESMQEQPEFLAWDPLESYIEVHSNGESAARAEDGASLGSLCHDPSAATAHVLPGALKEILGAYGPGARAVPRGGTALHIAAEAGDLVMIRMLIRAKVNMMAQDCSGRTALHVAIEKGHAEVASTLLTGPHIVDMQRDDGQTSVHLAAALGRIKTLEQLIAAGGDVEAKDECGRTPLHVAVAQGCEDAVQLLLDKGADVNAPIL